MYVCAFVCACACECNAGTFVFDWSVLGFRVENMIVWPDVGNQMFFTTENDIILAAAPIMIQSVSYCLSSFINESMNCCGPIVFQSG